MAYPGEVASVALVSGFMRGLAPLQAHLQGAKGHP